MKVYVETNFLVHEVFMQDQTWAISQIHSLVRSRKLQLRCPVVAFGEALSRVSNGHGWRDHFKRTVLEHPSIKELRQMPVRQGIHEKQVEIADALLDLRVEEEDRLESVLSETLALGELLPLSKRTFTNSVRLRNKYELHLADSLVAASVLIDIADSRLSTDDYPVSLFISSDRDFWPIKKELDVFNCTLIQNLEHAVEFIKHNTQSKK